MAIIHLFHFLKKYGTGVIHHSIWVCYLKHKTEDAQ